MDKRVHVGLGVGGVLVAAAGVVWWAHRYHTTRTPAWTDAMQPPEGYVASPATSWGAGGCPSAAGASPGRSVGSRIRRTYAPSLDLDPDSIVRGLA